jgi:small subunit ribosomal protein S9
MSSAKEANIQPPQSPGKNTIYATGRRKEATARVWVKSGSGKITINRKNIMDYLTRPTHRMMISRPFTLTSTVGSIDVWCTVKGGGPSGQTGAICHGISRALVKLNIDLRSKLKKAGLLTRDDRTVEPKKYGRHKARRGFQFAKR